MADAPDLTSAVLVMAETLVSAVQFDAETVRHLTCSELESIALVLDAAGLPDHAHDLRYAHGANDDEGDDHYGIPEQRA